MYFSGTNNIITACEQENVSRLIYCSTVDVVIGHEEIIEGTEENTSPPEQYLFPGYPKSKYKAECLVLRANGTTSKDGTLHVENKRPMGHYAHQSSSIGEDDTMTGNGLLIILSAPSDQS